MAALDHPEPDLLAEEEQSVEVDGHRRTPPLHGLEFRRRRAAHAGIVDQHVDVAGDGLGRLGEGDDRVVVGHVGRHDDDTVSEFGRELVEAIGATSGDDNGGPGAVQDSGEPSSQPRRGAGHHRHLAVE